MSTGADLKAREGGIPNDSNLNMTQEQSFKKGKNHTWNSGYERNRRLIIPASFFLIDSIFLTAANSQQCQIMMNQFYF